jgi:hypothetical protein
MRNVRDFINDPRTQAATRHVAAAARHGAVASGRASWAMGRFAIRRVREHVDRRMGRNQPPRLISAFEGEPETAFTRDEQGNTMAVIRARVLTPGRAKIADRLAPLASFGLFAGSLSAVALIAPRSGIPAWLIAGIVPWFLTPVFQNVFRRKLREQTILAFTPAHLVVRTGRGAAEIHDRENPHRFRLETRHEAAITEAERHELAIERARLRGKVIRPVKYQRETQHLMIEHERYPRFIMEIMGREEAIRVLGRINQVEAHMERIAAMGDVPAGGPQVEWDDMPGKIPEKV